MSKAPASVVSGTSGTPGALRLPSGWKANPTANTESDGGLAQQIERVRRIGMRLFDVANCVVKLGDEIRAVPVGERSMASIEVAFCDSVERPAGMMVVSDTRTDKALSQNRMVVGAPYIRFFASQPILGVDGGVLGSVNLIAYSARAFEADDQQLLADLASLMEKELRLAAVSASQQDLLKKNRTLRRESLVDPVIGTWNRSAISRMLATEIERCYNDGKPLSLLFADFTAFKEISDIHGLPVAEKVLLKFSSRLRSCIRPTDALGRYEGETFMVILPGAPTESAAVVAQRMLRAMALEPEAVGGAFVELALCVGIVSTDSHPDATTEELVELADAALRRAKQVGIGQWVMADAVAG